MQSNTDEDSYILFHKLISEKKNYDIIDIDPYGFPSRFMPDIFLLIENGLIFITIPHHAVNVLNRMTQELLNNYFDSKKPSIEMMIEKIKKYAMCHWRELEVLDVQKMNRVYRVCFSVKRVKANIYCNSRNK